MSRPTLLYQSIVASMNEAVVVYDPDGQVLIANRSAHGILGLGVGDGWVHPDWRIIQADGCPLEPSEFPAAVTLRGGGGLKEVVLGFEKPDEETTWVAIGSHPLVGDGGLEGVVMTLRDITTQHCLEGSLRFIAERGRDYGDRPYLQAVALYLAHTFKVDMVIIGEMVPERPTIIRSHVFYHDGAIGAPIEYDLAGTPCENVVGRELCCYPSAVATLFPTDRDLVEMHAEGYAGVPLWDAAGQALGILNMVSRRPLQRVESVASTLALFAVSVAHELEQARLEAERQHTAHELRQSLARLVQVMHLSHLGIADWEIPSDVTHWWGEMHRIFGIAPDQFTGRGSDYVQMVHPDDMTTIGEIIGTAFDTGVTEAELLTGKMPLKPRAFRIVRPDGSICAVECAAVAVLNEEGLPLRIFGFMQDVTERRALETELALYRQSLEQLVEQRTAELAATNERLAHEVQEHIYTQAALYTEKERTETILRHVANPVIMTDPDGRIVYANAAFETFYGYRASEVLGQTPRFLQSGQTETSTYVEMWATILKGRSWSGLVFNRTKGGALVDVLLTIVPVCNPVGEIIHFVAVHQDMTEARHFAAMKEAFIANAAHDLANPVAALGMTLNLLKVAPDLFKDRLPALERQVKRLDGLVNDLLLVSRLDRKMLQPEVRPLCLSTLVRHVVDGQTDLARQKAIELQIGAMVTPLLIEGDVHQLERVVVNLVANALNYTLGGGRVVVSTALTAHAALFTVQDTGIGIAAKDLPRIFERFYRTENAKEHGYGTGLGLAIVKEILDLHGGAVAVESVLGEGTTVTVSLPLGAGGGIAGG